MEQKHRKRIDVLCDLIVRQVDIKALWPYLFINGIFTRGVSWNLPVLLRDVARDMYHSCLPQ